MAEAVKALQRLSLSRPAASPIGAAPPSAAGPHHHKHHHHVTNWKSKSGRTDGPDTYVCGDLARPVLQRAAASSSRERDELYGGPVILVAVIEGLALGGSSEAAVSCVVAVVDEAGRESKADRRATRAVVPVGSTVQWDEVHTLGEHSQVADIKCVTIHVQRSTGAFGSTEQVGDVVLPLQMLRDSCDASLHGFTDQWYPVLHPRRGPCGKVRLALLLHVPPPDPTPLSIAVRLVEARNLRMSDAVSGGSLDAYVRLMPLSRHGEHQLDAADAGRRAELRSSTKSGGANPVWNEQFVLWDLAAGGEEGVLAALASEASEMAAAAAAAGSGGTGSAASNSAAAAMIDAITDPRQWPPPLPTDVEATATRASDTKRGLGSLARASVSLAAGWSAALRSGGAAASPIRSPSTSTTSSDGMGVGKSSVTLSLANTRNISFVFSGYTDAALKSDEDLGAVSLSISALFGDEDAVLTTHTLRVDKWFRITPHGSLGPVATGTLGHVRLDVTLLFAESLLPLGWMEAVDDETGVTYFHDRLTGRSTWEEPPAQADLALTADRVNAVINATSHASRNSYDGGRAPAATAVPQAPVLPTPAKAHLPLVSSQVPPAVALQPVPAAAAAATAEVATVTFPVVEAATPAPLKRSVATPAATRGGGAESDDSDGGGADSDDGVEGQAAPSAADVAAAEAAAGFGGGRASAKADAAALNNPMAGQLAAAQAKISGAGASSADERARLFLVAMREEAAAKKAAESAALQVSTSTRDSCRWGGAAMCMYDSPSP